jgi:hypothetical protein
MKIIIYLSFILFKLTIINAIYLFEKNEFVTLKLFGFNGQLLQTNELKGSQIELNLSAYNSGLYWLLVSNSNGQTKSKN